MNDAGGSTRALQLGRILPREEPTFDRGRPSVGVAVQALRQWEDNLLPVLALRAGGDRELGDLLDTADPREVAIAALGALARLVGRLELAGETIEIQKATLTKVENVAAVLDRRLQSAEQLARQLVRITKRDHCTACGQGHGAFGRGKHCAACHCERCDPALHARLNQR